MTYNIAGPTPKTVLQFYIHFTDAELEMYKNHEYGCFEESVLTRVLSVLHATSHIKENNQINACITSHDLALRQVMEKTGLVIARFSDVFDIDESCEILTDSIFSEILHGCGFANLYLYPYDKSLSNEPEDANAWTMWSYDRLVVPEFDKDENIIDSLVWPPPKDYQPFITPIDYQTFIDNDDNLIRCIDSFKKEFPDFLRREWSDEYHRDIKKIEHSNSPIETFNQIIDYPGTGGYYIIDDLFTNTDQESLKILSYDTYSIIGYFYGIHLYD